MKRCGLSILDDCCNTSKDRPDVSPDAGRSMSNKWTFLPGNKPLTRCTPASRLKKEKKEKNIYIYITKGELVETLRWWEMK